MWLEQGGYKNLLFPLKIFIKSKYRSGTSDENLASELSCVVSWNYTPDFKDLV